MGSSSRGSSSIEAKPVPIIKRLPAAAIATISSLSFDNVWHRSPLLDCYKFDTRERIYTQPCARLWCGRMSGGGVYEWGVHVCEAVDGEKIISKFQ